MKRIITACLCAIALVSLCDRSAHAFDLFHRIGCDQPCCDSGCSDACCDAAPSCNGDSACDGCDACDACGICGQSSRGCSCLGRMKLLGCLKPSDHCFDDFISPMINFVFFEDPRTLTELRPIYLYHNLPDRVGTLGLPGGAVQLYALQFRIALTDRLSLIAVKDGYIVADLDDGLLDTVLNDGWAAVTAGLKYNLVRDQCRGRLASVGFTYELPVGSRRSLQDIGDGEFYVFASGGQRLWNGNGHLMSAFGYRFPVDDDVQTSSFHWSNHFDIKVTKRAYLVTEVAWWHWSESAATGAQLGVAGQDLFNLSATNVAGHDLVTQNVGLKVKPSGNVEAGIAYEFPLTGFQDIIKDRIQLDLILRY